MITTKIMKTKTKKPKKEKFSVYPIEAWSVNKYGVNLFVNLTSLAHHFKDGVALDVEDDEQGNFVGLGIFDGTACYYWSDWNLAKGLRIPRFIAHNGRSDIAKLRSWGFQVDESNLMWDTLLMSHILDSSRKRYGLKVLAKADVGFEYPSYEDITGKRTTKAHTTLDKLPLDLVSNYNALDCYATYKLYELQTKGRLTSRELEIPEVHYFSDLEKPASFVFQRMEERGVKIDVSYLRKLQGDLETARKNVQQAIFKEFGEINLNSPKQLLGALHAKGIKPELKTRPSTDKRALDRFRSNPIVSDLLQYSEIDTLLSSFVNPYLERNADVVHPQYNQCGTRTGRPSCANPNLLQIPRRTENGKLVRRMFIAREGNLFGDCDFGQIEPRVLAHLSKDKAMCQMFNEGIDFHSFTSENLKIDREKAKVLNLSVGYRATHVSVSQQLKCSYETAQAEIDGWWAMFPGLYDWEQRLIYESRKSGYFTTLLGRKIKVDDLNHGNPWRREVAERQLINNIAQGSAAEIMKLAMINVDKLDVRILVQVYDELLWEEKEDVIEDAMNAVVQTMETCIKLDVPLVVDGAIGKNWAEVH